MAKSDMKEDMKMDLAQDKKMIKSAVGKHEKNMHPGKPMTKLKAGGPTSMDRMKMGRNLSRANNQKPGSK
jgi:hypothetical protein